VVSVVACGPRGHAPGSQRGLMGWAANSCESCLMAVLCRLFTVSNPLGSVNEDQPWLGRQRQVWFISFVDKCMVACLLNCEIPRQHMPYLSVSSVLFLHWGVLYHMYELYLFAIQHFGTTSAMVTWLSRWCTVPKWLSRSSCDLHRIVALPF